MSATVWQHSHLRAALGARRAGMQLCKLLYIFNVACRILGSSSGPIFVP